MSKEQNGRKDYWLDEPRSLGVEPKHDDEEINDSEELEALANSIKKVSYQDYKSACSHDNIDESHFDYII